jgi:hypothetical protein
VFEHFVHIENAIIIVAAVVAITTNYTFLSPPLPLPSLSLLLPLPKV